MKFSVIIPVYNAEKTLRRCVDSLLNQNFNDAEIILINDGSTDSSADICREYEQNDKRVVFIDKRNGGVSSARNAGLDIAKGEFITFVDSDDYVSEDFFSVLKGASDNNYDYVLFSNIETNGLYRKNHISDNFSSSLKDDIIPAIIDFIVKKKVNTPWGKLFKKDIIDNLRLRFNENLSIAEDWLFNLMYIYEINSFASYSNVVYYVSTENQNSLSRKYRADLYEQLQMAGEANKAAFESSHLEEKYKNEIRKAFNFLKYSEIYSENKRMHISQVAFFDRLKKTREQCKSINKEHLTILSDKRSVLLSLPVKLSCYILIDIAGWYLSR